MEQNTVCLCGFCSKSIVKQQFTWRIVEFLNITLILRCHYHFKRTTEHIEHSEVIKDPDLSHGKYDSKNNHVA